MVSSVQHIWRLPSARLRDKWSSLSLAGQFVIAALLVLSGGMTIFGLWVSERIKAGVIQNSATGAALYFNSIIEPHVQELRHEKTLRPASERNIDALLAGTALGQKVVVIKLWARDGTVLYSNRKELAGKTFPVTPNLAGAWRGKVTAEFDSLHDEENESERKLKMPLLEIYAPVREVGSDRVIAVVEFYEEALDLRQNLRRSQLQSWFVVALVTLAMLSVLFGIVRKGSHTIGSQQQTLHDRISQLSSLLAQNEQMRKRIDELHLRAVETNEHFLRRVGMELHDGPAQLIGFALLRLDSLHGEGEKPDARARTDGLEKVRGALDDALTDIRNISAGLTLPEMEDTLPAEILRLAARNHESRTGTRVACDIGSLPAHLSMLLKSCLYRFTQEALNNAYRHAGGRGQSVQGSYKDGIVEIAVSDTGPGFEVDSAAFNGKRLGLTGMRDRVVSLGGSFDLASQPGTGTRVTARFEVDHDAK